MSEKISPSFSSTVKLLLGLLMKNAKLYTFCAIATFGLGGLLTAGNTLVKQWFFTSIEDLAFGGNISKAVALGIFMGAFLVLVLIVQGVSDVLSENLGILLSGFLGRAVNEKAAKTDPICYENTVMLNDINKAYEGVKNAGDIINILMNYAGFYIPFLLFFTVYLYRIHPALSIAMYLVFIPTFAGHIIREKYYSELEETSAPYRRKMNYYENCIADREYAKDTRLLGAVWFFRTLYETSIKLFQKEQWKTKKKGELLELALRLASLLCYIIMLVLLYYFLSTGIIGIAVFTAVFTSIDQLFNEIDYMGYSMGEISYLLPSVKNTMNFLSLPERQGEPAEIKDYSIDFMNVSFSYPNTDKNTIENINFSIENGETIAIVGENGAGKSTLVKLLLGLYTPSSGSILIGGHNTKNTAPKSLFQNTSAVFQKFQRYKMTLKENIAIGDFKKINDNQKLKETIYTAKLDIDGRSFPQGMDTLLSREFGGTDLSGGQWQKIAIGRGLFRSHKLIILDEPTAAIDPVEETRIYKQFAEISKDKTSIIVTHRLGSAKIADRIIVMDQGQIADIGTHQELIAHNGLYKKMYDAQAKWYE